ncbi:MAG: STT3 domain-containing protein [Candidatus Woesearchaeota archaeon]
MEEDDEISFDLSKIKDLFKRKKKDDEKKLEVHGEIEKKDAEIKHEIDKTAEIKQDEQKDDEISIDLSKIKNIFRKKESATDEKAETKDDDEISIDFSKIKNIKNIFKKSETTDSEEGLSVDFKKISSFFVQYRVLLLLLIPIFLSIFLRVQPAYLPATDDWATSSVMDSLRSQIRSQIDQQYPNLPSQNKNVLVEDELKKVLQQEKSQIDQQIKATSNYFKSRLQDDTGQTYLIAIDPYFWMRHAQNVLKNGHPGDEIRDGQQWDNHMFAPEGRGMPPDMFNAYFEAYLFKFISFFNKDIGLMRVIFYVPVLISALAVIPAFFITRKIAGNLGGFIAATVLAIHPSFLTRTVGGFADTDAYNVMFPLFIAWLFLEALEAKNTKNSIILSVAGGLLTGLYALTWGGWWYIFDFVLISTVLYVAYYTFVHRKELTSNFIRFTKQKAIKNSITFLIIFFVVSALSVSLFVNFGHFTQFVKNPSGFARLKEVGITTIWPNVFTTVAEQNPASLNNVINDVGLGKVYFFLIALIGITLTTTRKEHKKIWFIIGTLVWYLILALLHNTPFVQDLHTFLILISIPIIIRIVMALLESDTGIDIKYAIFLILWFIATTFASTKGIRFTLLLVPAFAIGFGIALGELYKYASVWIAKGLQVNKYISKTTVIIILLLLLIAPYKSAAGIAKNEIPSFNDAWRISLEKIKDDSKPDAIVNSWWDFGHWFKFWTDRAVTFDGTSQNTPQAHWIGKALLTDNEDISIGILRMLDCSGGTMPGGTKAFEIINEKTRDGAETISILNGVIAKDKEEARKYLKETFSNNKTEEILLQTHCQPPENYFITSDDMIGKSGVWGHFGSWDFNRGLIYNTLKKKDYSGNLDKSVAFLKERFNYSNKEAEDLFYEVQSIKTSDQANNWIAPWPSYAGGASCSRNENILTCNNGFKVNLTAREAFAETSEGLKHPAKISFPTNEGIIVKEYNKSLINLQSGRGLGLALIKNGDNYEMLQMDSDMTASMFTRLFYQEGIGLKHFKKFSDERSVFGNRIIVWKIDWEGRETNIIEAPESDIFQNTQ